MVSMKFYSGFSLKNESYLFKDYINSSEYSVCGFSYGAIKAFQEVKKQLELGNRVDTLQLFSPAFFQTKDDKFKSLQLLAYRRNEDVYLHQFINSCFFPYEKKIVEYSATVIDELDELLNYKWNLEELKKLTKAGVRLEVYIGSEDRIVNADDAKKFFIQVATVTFVKKANHFLQTD